MSLSSQNEGGAKNPAKRFIEFSGSKKIYSYYDKEKKENIELKVPFQVIILDQLATIKGYDSEAESGIYSQEVRSTTDTPLTVKNFKGDLIAQGFYQDIKGKLNGGKYTKSVYAVMVDKNGVGDLVNIAVKGSGLSPWIDAEKAAKANGINLNSGVVLTLDVNPEQKKKGATKYYEPMFEFKALPDGKDKDAATQIDAEVLQPYLEQYLGAAPQKQEEAPREVKTGLEQTPISTVEAEEEELDTLPF